MKKNIKSLLRKKKSRKGYKVFGVGPYGDAYYGYIVERGHRVGKRPRKKGAALEQAGLSPAPKNVPPHPFLIPTFYAMIHQIIRATKQKLSDGIAKEGNKLGFTARR